MIATAIQNNLIVATRNTSDLLPCGVQVINPWE
jgi:predicted nucleic acid-binding protein